MLVPISEQAASAQKTIQVKGIFIDGPAIASLFLVFLTPPNVLVPIGTINTYEIPFKGLSVLFRILNGVSTV